MYPTRKTAVADTKKPPQQLREPSFRIVVWLWLVVLAAGLIGGGWYGHLQLVEKTGAATPATVTVKQL